MAENKRCEYIIRPALGTWAESRCNRNAKLRVTYSPRPSGVPRRTKNVCGQHAKQLQKMYVAIGVQEI